MIVCEILRNSMFRYILGATAFALLLVGSRVMISTPNFNPFAENQMLNEVKEMNKQREEIKQIHAIMEKERLAKIEKEAKKKENVVYKWKDDKGQLMLTDEPPIDGRPFKKMQING